MNSMFDCHWQNCSRIYSDPEQLYNHLTNDHVGRKSTGNLCLTCHWDDCKVSVIKRDHITSHLRVHVPLKPYHCNYCDKSFKRPQDLKKHERIHSEKASTSQYVTSSNYSKISLSPNATVLSHTPISPPHSTITTSTYSEDDHTQPGSSNNTVLSPSSDYYDSFSSSIQQEPSTPCLPSNYLSSSGNVMNTIMFADESCNQMRTDYNADMMNNLDMLQYLVDNGSINQDSFNMDTEEQLNKFNLWLSQITKNIPDQSMYEYSHMQQQPISTATNYTNMLLQFDSNTILPNNNDLLYPITTTNNQQEDMYVRSYPINQQPTIPTQTFPTPPPPEKLYSDNLNQLNNYYPHMNGLRQHYAIVPDIIPNQNLFTPDLQRNQNLFSSRENIKYKKTSDNSSLNKGTCALHDESIKKQSPAKKSPINNNILDLLVSDMTDLTILEGEKEKRKKEKTLYPTTRIDSKDNSKQQRHRILLQQLSQWINENYAKKQRNTTSFASSSSSTTTSSVQVQ
ncbi:uncharacterized protein BX663DRAFT_497139 [Cokeromyces recurvatus]|uniref:uncharacterized protein n=1 Tax=Cokeromyces recurvatus TaxID=90255 RepID=UPI00221FE794|nr:uncharacterized protein BX663DRAFT_497139 [Cokeromyces recurvatus]KAI7906627.1 hypothetical protein BX663DRAFT_497139 [Cokeromyces recurvatus]